MPMARWTHLIRSHWFSTCSEPEESYPVRNLETSMEINCWTSAMWFTSWCSCSAVARTRPRWTIADRV